MRNCIKAALAAGLALVTVSTDAFAHGSGGGGSHIVIVTVGPGVPAMPPFRGDEASMALEITDASPTRVEGDMERGDVIAVHVLRSADAVVLDEAVKGRRREIPAGRSATATRGRSMRA